MYKTNKIYKNINIIKIWKNILEISFRRKKSLKTLHSYKSETTK